MKTRKEFESNFQKVIRENKINTKLINHINENFIKKGLSINTPLLLFEDGMGLDELTLNERICLSVSMYEYLHIKLLNPKDYFSDTELTSYDLLVSIPSKKANIVVFKEVKKLNDKSYVGVLNSSQAVEMRDNRLFSYFKEVQRPTVNVKSKGEVIRRINVNREGVIDLRDRMLSHSIFPTAITFSVLSMDGKDINVTYKPKGETVGDLIIKPNFNRNDDDYTPLIINDGYHRLSSLIEAQEVNEKNGNGDLNESLYCIINITTLEEAKQYFLDSFKHNILKEEELKPLVPSNKGKFIDSIINNSSFLRNKVGTSYRDMKTSNKVTYKSLLLDMVDKLNIELKSDIQCNLLGERFSKLLEDILNGILEFRFDGNIKEFNNSFYNSINIYAAYLFLVDYIKKDSNKIIDMINLLIGLEEEDFVNRGVNLNTKKVDLDEMILFLRELVINNDI